MKLYKDKHNNIFAYELDGSQNHLIGDKQSITQKEADDILFEKQKNSFDALTYAEKRKKEYPLLEEQLDIIYHHGLEEWKKVIDEVKKKYPKE